MHLSWWQSMAPSILVFSEVLSVSARALLSLWCGRRLCELQRIASTGHLRVILITIAHAQVYEENAKRTLQGPRR